MSHSLELLVHDDVVAKLLVQPLQVQWVYYGVLEPSEDSDGDAVDGTKIIGGRHGLIVLFQVSLGAEVVPVEIVSSNELPVVNEAPKASTRGEEGEAPLVVYGLVQGTDEAVLELAELFPLQAFLGLFYEFCFVWSEQAILLVCFDSRKNLIFPVGEVQDRRVCCVFQFACRGHCDKQAHLA